MAISFVATRATTGIYATTTTVTVATSTAIAVGNVLVMAAKLSGGKTIQSISDTRSNNWLTGAYNQTTAPDIDFWYEYVTTPFQAGDLITLTASGATNQITNVILMEFAGLSQDFGSFLDARNSPGVTAVPTNATTKTMALTTSTLWKDLVFAGIGTGATASQTFTYNTGNGWTGVSTTGPSATIQMGVQWKIQTAVGTESTTISWSSSQTYAYAMFSLYPKNPSLASLGVGG
jgi:hypothetical protein